MKHLLTIILLFGCCHQGFSQDEKRSYLGIGIGQMTYTSFWFVNLSSTTTGDIYPIHNIERTYINLLYQRNAIFNLGAVRVDLATELRAGIGKTIEDFLPLGETISEGGVSLGLSAIFKFGYPVNAGNLTIIPSIGLGPQIDVLYSNGQFPDSNQFANDEVYEEGWLETVYGLGIQAEVALAFNRITVMPSYRFFATGAADTDLEPDGREPLSEGVDLSAFAITIAFAL